MENEQPDKTTDSKSKSKLVPVLILALLMIGEGIGVFLLANAISPSPAKTLAQDLAERRAGGADGPGGTSMPDAFGEVELADCRPSNIMSGKFVTFHIRVTGLVAAEDVERAEQLMRASKARLEFGVNTVMRGAEPKEFNEPEFATLRRRLKLKFDEIIGDDQLIKAVIIPQLYQSGSGN